MANTNIQLQMDDVGGDLANFLQISTERWLEYDEANAIFLRQLDPNPPFLETHQLFGPGPPYQEGLFFYPDSQRFADRHNWTPVPGPRRRNCIPMRLGPQIGCTVATLTAQDGGGGLFWRRTHHHQMRPPLALVHYRRQIPFAAANEDDDDEEAEEDDEEAAEEEEEAAEAEVAAAEEAADEAEYESSSDEEDDFLNDPTYIPGRNSSKHVEQSIVEVGDGNLKLGTLMTEQTFSYYAGTNDKELQTWILSGLTLDPLRDSIHLKAYELEKNFLVKLLQRRSFISLTTGVSTPISKFEGHTADDAVLCVQELDHVGEMVGSVERVTASCINGSLAPLLKDAGPLCLY